MSNYSSILEAYLIDMDDIAEEGAGDTLRKLGNTIKTKVQELIRLIVKLWNRAKESIRNMINSAKAAKDTIKAENDKIDQEMSDHYYHTGAEIGQMLKAFGNSSVRVYDRCIKIITSDMINDVNTIINYESKENEGPCQEALKRIEYDKNQVMELISELPNINSDIDDKLSSLKRQSIAMERSSKSGLRRGFMTTYPDPDKMFSVFNDSGKSKLIETLNKLVSLESHGQYSSHAISKVIVTTQTVLSSLNSYTAAIHKVESKVFNLMHSN